MKAKIQAMQGTCSFSSGQRCIRVSHVLMV
uniref:Uncharacterized protein n=1 Tax=Arundo donax TaxID=35708 RepID=A0A0A9HQG3_ARUDO